MNPITKRLWILQDEGLDDLPWKPATPEMPIDAEFWRKFQNEAGQQSQKFQMLLSFDLWKNILNVLHNSNNSSMETSLETHLRGRTQYGIIHDYIY